MAFYCHSNHGNLKQVYKNTSKQQKPKKRTNRQFQWVRVDMPIRANSERAAKKKTNYITTTTIRDT